MAQKILFIVISIVLIFTACSPASAPTLTPTILPTFTQPPTDTPLPSPTPTPESQILGRIFPEGFDSIGVSCNINTGSIDSQDTHFDVRVPEEFWHNAVDCPVYSPADGTIWEIYSVGEPKGSGGEVIGIRLSKKPQGIERVLDQFDIDPKKVSGYGIHLGHITLLNENLKPGDYIEKGTLLSEGVFAYGPEPGVAYVIYIWYDNKQIQVSPCSADNTASFCGVCYQYEGYCPETDLNFPEGGIQWWDEGDSFWNTHEITLHAYAY